VHLDDRTIEELGTLDARRHLAECASCQTRAAQLEAIRRSLTLIDHQVPTIDVTTVMARVRQRRRAPVLIAAASALLAAALAAALPSSPVRRAIARVLDRHQSAPRVQHAAVARGGSSIAIQLHDSARVVFRSRQTTGTVSIAEDSGHALRITQIDGKSVGFAVTPSGVTIANTGSAGSYEIRVPAGARVVILVGTDTAFVTGPDHVTPRVFNLAAP
jgi:CheY-like chemotaxis protein